MQEKGGRGKEEKGGLMNWGGEYMLCYRLSYNRTWEVGNYALGFTEAGL